MKINDVLNEQQLDELNWQDVKQGAKNAAGTAVRGAQALGRGIAAVPGAIQRGAGAIERGANAYTQGLQKTGNAVAGAANAVGRAGAETFKQGVARPVGALWGAGKNIAQNAANVTRQGYNDVKAGTQAVGQGVTTARQDLGAAGQWAGNEIGAVGRGIGAVGRGAASALGGVGRAVGATAAVPQGVGRAMKSGYQTGVQNIGGADPSAQNQAPAQAQAGQQSTGTTTTRTPGAQGGGLVQKGGEFTQGFAQGLGANDFAKAQDDYRTAAMTGGQTAEPTDNYAQQPQQQQPQQQQPQQATKKPSLSVKQINQAIPTLKKRDLNSVKKTVDTAIAKKQKPAQAQTGKPYNQLQGRVQSAQDQAVPTNESADFSSIIWKQMRGL
jgi:hypothetical protein